MVSVVAGGTIVSAMAQIPVVAGVRVAAVDVGWGIGLGGMLGIHLIAMAGDTLEIDFLWLDGKD